MFIKIVFELVGFCVTQARFEVMTHRMLSPAPGLQVKVFELPPLFNPFLFHWYDGRVPPLKGNAVKVTPFPTQKGFVDAEIVTPAGKFVFTVIIIVFDAAGLPMIQLSVDEIKHSTWSPLTGV